MTDHEHEVTPSVGMAQSGASVVEGELIEYAGAFLVPDAESRSGWRHYHVRKPGEPTRRQAPIGFARPGGRQPRTDKP